MLPARQVDPILRNKLDKSNPSLKFIPKTSGNMVLERGVSFKSKDLCLCPFFICKDSCFFSPKLRFPNKTWGIGRASVWYPRSQGTKVGSFGCQKWAVLINPNTQRTWLWERGFFPVCVSFVCFLMVLNSWCGKLSNFQRCGESLKMSNWMIAKECHQQQLSHKKKPLTFHETLVV